MNETTPEPSPTETLSVKAWVGAELDKRANLPQRPPERWHKTSGENNALWNLAPADIAACESWRAGTQPDDGAYSPASLTGLMLASGLKVDAFARAIGTSPMTLNRWRRASPMRNGQPSAPTEGRWAGIVALMASRVAK